MHLHSLRRGADPDWDALDRGEGFFPVRLPDGRDGFVAAIDAFSPVGPRMRIVVRTGEWFVTWFGSGE
jgi:hypothetical protein